MVREVALDTETTGLSPKDGHRIVEIACVEMENRIRTGNVYHTYVNPERDVPLGAFEVHGLSEEFLKDKPKFSEVAGDFLNFVSDSKLVIHNAKFDILFLNAELTWAKKKEIKQAQVFCTLVEARRKFPGSPASLDALCKRFNIDLSARTKHGALLDTELLADMYLELMGGLQVSMELKNSVSGTIVSETNKKKALKPRSFSISEEELAAHAEFLKQIKEPIWAG